MVLGDLEQGKWGDVGQSVQTFSYKMTIFWRSSVQNADMIS